MRSEAVSWEEKYRPRNLDEVCGHEREITELRDYLKSGDCPHLLLKGPPGTGKTATARIIASLVAGPDGAADWCEWNASDERGLDFIRERVIPFGRSLPFGGRRRVVILDEADGLTREAQDALKRPLEVMARNCLFILTANDATKIIPPLLSRLRVMDFQGIPAETAAPWILRLLGKEGVEADLELILELCRRVEDESARSSYLGSGVDMRKAIQSARAFAQASPEVSPARAPTGGY